MKLFLRLVLLPHIVRSAMQVSLLVGTVLNLVNQGGALFSGGDISIWQLFLNYLVPYCVASYSAARNEWHRRKNE